MKNNQVILISVILIFIYLFIGWVITKPIIDSMINYYLNLPPKSRVIPATADEQFRMQLTSALAISCIPLINFLLVVLFRKFKNRIIDALIYYRTLILSLGFSVGVLLQILLFKKFIEQIDSTTISPMIINEFPLRVIRFYDLGIIFFLISALLILLTTKKVNTV